MGQDGAWQDGLLDLSWSVFSQMGVKESEKDKVSLNCCIWKKDASKISLTCKTLYHEDGEGD